MGALLVAGAGSFYFAKKEIDARRRLQNEAGTRPSEKRNCELVASCVVASFGAALMFVHLVSGYERLDDVPPNTAAAFPADAPPNTTKTPGDYGSPLK